MIKGNHRNNQNNMWNLFKVNNKDTRTTSLMLLFVFIVSFEQVSHIVYVFSLHGATNDILCAYIRTYAKEANSLPDVR